MNTFTEEIKAAIVTDYAAGMSAREVAKKHGCAIGSVSKWAKKAGVDKSAKVREQTAAATEAHEEYARRRRAELGTKMVDRAHEVLDRVSEPYKDVRIVDGKPAVITLDKPPARETRELLLGFAIVFDKVRLESGDVTDRTETITSDMIDREICRLEAEIARNRSEDED